MPALEGPYEILELGDGGTLVLHPQRWAKGTMVIHPRFQREPKTINVIRVWVPTADKPLFPDYFDITAATLVAQIEPILKRSDLLELEIAITKHGIPPKARYAVEVRHA